MSLKHHGRFRLSAISLALLGSFAAMQVSAQVSTYRPPVAATGSGGYLSPVAGGGYQSAPTPVANQPVLNADGSNPADVASSSPTNKSQTPTTGAIAKNKGSTTGNVGGSASGIQSADQANSPYAPGKFSGSANRIQTGLPLEGDGVPAIAGGRDPYASWPSAVSLAKPGVDPHSSYFKGTGVPEKGNDVSMDDIFAKHLEEVDKKPSKKDLSPIKAQLIQQTAASFGTQAGLAHRSYEINLALARQQEYLTKLYDFRLVMMEEGVLPPVLSEAQNAYKQNSDTEVRIAGVLYQIVTPSRIVSNAPIWQDYLVQPFTVPKLPDPQLLPHSDEESAIWDEWVKKGWIAGLQQGNLNFQDSLGRLTLDFKGMIRYRTLLDQGMITRAMVARSNLGVTGGGNEMAVDDQIFRITDKAALVKDDKQWHLTGRTLDPLHPSRAPLPAFSTGDR